MKKLTGLALGMTLVAMPGIALAQGATYDTSPDVDTSTSGPPSDDDTNGRGPADPDPRPAVPRPAAGVESGIIEQAGIGGRTAYARAGVLELGGSIGFTAASDLTAFDFSPSVGWFLADNLEISVLTGLNYVKSGGGSSTFAKLLLEPSYHLPFNEMLFGFVGMGAGVTYAKNVDAGFAIAPRFGMNIMVGRSGILTPAVSWIYSTNDLSTNSAGGSSTTATARVSSAVNLNVGYTVMW